jgi:glycosyltransferase involved in cell wall biosynthesis
MEVRDLWPAIFVELGVLRDRRLIWLLERWELAMYRAAARVVTVTESFRENLISRNIPANKVVTITNGADTEFWSTKATSGNLRQELGLTDKFVVLYIGAHGITQGLGAILQAAERVQSDPRLMFLFVGDGAKKAELVATADRLALRNVRFFDSVGKTKVREFYAMADVCLVPLRDIPAFGGFIPSKMFEIMSMGRPIIGCLRGEPAAILERSAAARVVPPEDAQAIADSVLKLANDEVGRISMGKSGRTFVEMHYSRRSLAERYRSVLSDVGAERPR